MYKKFLAFCFFVFSLSFISASGLFDTAENVQHPDKNASISVSENQESGDQNQNMKKLASVYNFLLENYVDELDPDVLYKAAMEGMFDSLNDPYSEYFEQDSSLGVSLQDTTTGSFGGIGVTITKPVKSTPEKPAYVEVSSAIDGTPGAKAGLRSGDYITEIDGTKTEDITMEEVLSILRGKPGTQVTIQVLRGKNLSFDLTIKRAKIEVPTVKYQMLDNHIGYIQLIEFNPNSAPRIQEAYDNLKNQGATKLILDLRDNPGGLLSAAIDVASIFLQRGVVTSTDGRMPDSQTTFNVNRTARHIPAEIPMVTLINNGSASSSEILAGSLKDNKRTVLVGDNTYGKGVVQLLYDINNRESFKFTSSRYYTPSGANIHKIGIPPDYPVSLPEVSDSEVDEFKRLNDSGLLDTFAKSKDKITTAEIKNYAKTLQETYQLRLEILELALKYRVNSYTSHPITDPYFDTQLSKAIELLTTEDVNKLAEQTKTVAELQAEAAAKNEDAAAKNEDAAAKNEDAAKNAAQNE